MDVVILVVLVGIVIFVFKSFKGFVYFMALFDMLLRIIALIKVRIGIPELKSFFDAYFPSSILSIIDKYSIGIFNTVLVWLYIALFIVFEYYVIRAFFKMK